MLNSCHYHIMHTNFEDRWWLPRFHLSPRFFSSKFFFFKHLLSTSLCNELSKVSKALGVDKEQSNTREFKIQYVLCCVQSLSHVKLCDSMDCNSPGSFVCGDSPGKNTGVVCHALLQGIFPTQGSNPSLLLCSQILCHLSHQGSPRFSADDKINQSRILIYAGTLRKILMY